MYFPCFCVNVLSILTLWETLQLAVSFPATALPHASGGAENGSSSRGWLKVAVLAPEQGSRISSAPESFNARPINPLQHLFPVLSIPRPGWTESLKQAEQMQEAIQNATKNTTVPIPFTAERAQLCNIVLNGTIVCSTDTSYAKEQLKSDTGASGNTITDWTTHDRTGNDVAHYSTQGAVTPSLSIFPLHDSSADFSNTAQELEIAVGPLDTESATTSNRLEMTDYGTSNSVVEETNSLINNNNGNELPYGPPSTFFPSMHSFHGATLEQNREPLNSRTPMMIDISGYRGIIRPLSETSYGETGLLQQGAFTHGTSGIGGQHVQVERASDAAHVTIPASHVGVISNNVNLGVSRLPTVSLNNVQSETHSEDESGTSLSTAHFNEQLGQENQYAKDDVVAEVATRSLPSPASHSWESDSPEITDTYNRPATTPSSKILESTPEKEQLNKSILETTQYKKTIEGLSSLLAALIQQNTTLANMGFNLPPDLRQILTLLLPEDNNEQQLFSESTQNFASNTILKKTVQNASLELPEDSPEDNQGPVFTNRVEGTWPFIIPNAHSAIQPGESGDANDEVLAVDDTTESAANTLKSPAATSVILPLNEHHESYIYSITPIRHADPDTSSTNVVESHEPLPFTSSPQEDTAILKEIQPDPNRGVLPTKMATVGVEPRSHNMEGLVVNDNKDNQHGVSVISPSVDMNPNSYSYSNITECVTDPLTSLVGVGAESEVDSNDINVQRHCLNANRNQEYVIPHHTATTGASTFTAKTQLYGRDYENTVPLPINGTINEKINGLIFSEDDANSAIKKEYGETSFSSAPAYNPDEEEKESTPLGLATLSQGTMNATQSFQRLYAGPTSTTTASLPILYNDDMNGAVSVTAEKPRPLENLKVLSTDESTIVRNEAGVLLRRRRPFVLQHRNTIQNRTHENQSSRNVMETEAVGQERSAGPNHQRWSSYSPIRTDGYSIIELSRGTTTPVQHLRGGILGLVRSSASLGQSDSTIQNQNELFGNSDMDSEAHLATPLTARRWPTTLSHPLETQIQPVHVEAQSHSQVVGPVRIPAVDVADGHISVDDLPATVVVENAPTRTGLTNDAREVEGVRRRYGYGDDDPDAQPVDPYRRKKRPKRRRSGL